MQLNNTYLKYLKESHLYIGMFVILFFYISTFFGTITTLKPYLASWESPSKHIKLISSNNIDLDKSIYNGLNELDNPSNNVTITLPSYTEKSLSLKFGSSEKVYINPYTNEVLDTKKENYLLSNFFNQMHINLNVSSQGQILMGIASIGIVFLTINGLYLWLLNKRKRKDVKNFWLKWHKDFSLLILPYILIFSLTGAVLGFMLLASSPFAYSVTDGKEMSMGKLVRPTIYQRDVKIKALGERALMQNFNELHDIAKKSYVDLHITDIKLFNWNDKNARVMFVGYDKNNDIRTASVNRVGVILNGVSGEVVRIKKPDDTHIGAQFLSSFYFIHFITDEGIGLRIVLMLFGIIFGISLVFGAFIWIERKLKQKRKHNYFNIITKFTTAFVLGIIPATTFTLFLYWLLPVELSDRNTWIIGGFYTLWSFTFLLSVYKNDSLEAVKIFMYLNSLFLLLAFILHGYTTNMYLWNSFSNEIWDIFYMDLFILILGLLSFLFAIKMDSLKFLNKFRGY